MSCHERAFEAWEGAGGVTMAETEPEAKMSSAPLVKEVMMAVDKILENLASRDPSVES
jgi:hypothetical protein